MRHLTELVLFAALIPWHVYATAGNPAPGAFSYIGSSAGDDDNREFVINLAQAGTATMRRWSDAGGTNATRGQSSWASLSARAPQAQNQGEHARSVVTAAMDLR